MRKFWSWLGLNLGKHWIVVLAIGAVLTVGLGLRHHQARVLDRSGQLPQQERPGLQGQRRLPEPLRRRGDAHPRHDGQGPHGRRALHARRTSASGRPSRSSCAATSTIAQRRHPAHRARSSTTTSCSSPTGDPTQSVAGKILLGAARPGEDRRPGKRHATPTLRKTLTRIERDPCRQRIARQPEVRRLPAPRQPGTRSASRCAPFFPDDRHAQMVTRLHGQPVDQGRGRGRRLRRDRDRASSHFANAHDSPRRARRCCSRTSTTT